MTFCQIRWNRNLKTPRILFFGPEFAGPALGTGGILPTPSLGVQEGRVSVSRPPMGRGRSRGMSDVNREDWDLMQAVSQGDEAAAGVLYDRFGALVFRAARQVLSSRAESEDAVQEVFVRLWRTADRYDPERAKLVTWVMLITRRHLIDRLRRRRVRPLALSLEGDPAGRERSATETPGRIELDERRNLLLSRIEELPTLQREVIERAYLQGFTLREVSEQLDAPLGTVKSALSRGLARLRDRLSEDHRVRGGSG